MLRVHLQAYVQVNVQLCWDSLVPMGPVLPSSALPSREAADHLEAGRAPVPAHIQELAHTHSVASCQRGAQFPLAPPRFVCTHVVYRLLCCLSPLCHLAPFVPIWVIGNVTKRSSQQLQSQSCTITQARRDLLPLIS